MAQSQPRAETRLSTGIRISNGMAPAAGFEVDARRSAQAGQVDFLASIAAARQEVQLLFELTQDIGNSLSLDETLSVVAVRLRKMVPYDAIAVYIVRGKALIPRYVNGENYRLFSSLEIPMGEGLSGWVARTASASSTATLRWSAGYLNDPAKFSTLRSALAVPLEGLNGVIGTLTLYRAGKGRLRARPSAHSARPSLPRYRWPSKTRCASSLRRTPPPPTTSPCCPTPARCSCAWIANWRAAAGPWNRSRCWFAMWTASSR